MDAKDCPFWEGEVFCSEMIAHLSLLAGKFTPESPSRQHIASLIDFAEAQRDMIRKRMEAKGDGRRWVGLATGLAIQQASPKALN